PARPARRRRHGARRQDAGRRHADGDLRLELRPRPPARAPARALRGRSPRRVAGLRRRRDEALGRPHVERPRPARLRPRAAPVVSWGMRAVPLLLVLWAIAHADTAKAPDVIERQLTAYNAKNLDAFLACFAPDAELFEFPDKSLAKGTEALRARYAKRFADPILHATIADRMVGAKRVVDHEHITITWPEGPGTWDAVAIYEVEGNLIKRVWFVFGAKTVDVAKPR